MPRNSQSNPPSNTPSLRTPARLLNRSRWTRRGVVSVLSMMFLILFGSLAAAMAIMSKGNITTAATHQHVQRAMGAAETGLRIAEDRLREAVARFIVAKGEVDPAFGTYLWSSAQPGSHPTYGEIQVVPPKSYIDTAGTPTGIVQALSQIFARDASLIISAESGNLTAPAIRAAPSTADLTVYDAQNWLVTPIVALQNQPAPASGRPPAGTGFQVEYMPLRSPAGAEEKLIRIAVTGYDYDYTPGGQPVSRRVTQDFRLSKRVNAAILSPSKVMIGKNVLVEGDIGATFTGVTFEHGDPLIMRSDFWGLETGLNAELSKLFTALASKDADKDNRLRVGHPIEGPAIPDYASLPGYRFTENGIEYTGPDVTRDGLVDEFDVFQMYYDGRNGGTRDGKVALHADVSRGTPSATLTPEFVRASGTPIDNDLALLIDGSNPDRNKNTEFALIDRNGNGRFDPPETTNSNPDELVDQDVRSDAAAFGPSLANYVRTSTISNPPGQPCVFRDQVLGFRDGVIDRRDQYAKVRGRALFRTTSSAWQAARGDFMSRLQGPIKPPIYQSPMQFGVSTGDLPEITAANFAANRDRMQGLASGASFDQQVATNLGVSVSALATWTVANNSTAANAPKFRPLGRDVDRDGYPDNWKSTSVYYEAMPFGDGTPVDYYYRPVYENMVFVDVQIPVGNNGLFRNCVFVGSTYVRTTTTNTHFNWTNYGRMVLEDVEVAPGVFQKRPQHTPKRFLYTGPAVYGGLLPSDRPVWMTVDPNGVAGGSSAQALDKADIRTDRVPTAGYGAIPEPLKLPNGLRVINTKDLSNNIRFDSSTIYGSIVSDTPIAYTNVRNKLQFTGGTRFTMTRPTISGLTIPEIPDAQRRELTKSSMMTPQYSIDIGEFNASSAQDIRLRGAIIAGVLDIRGNADIQGSLILTHKPERGVAPMVDVFGQPIGNPANFNASIGYFGEDDGEKEARDPATLPEYNGQIIVGWSDMAGGPVRYPPSTSPPAANPSAFPVPFRGYGKITLRFDPTMALPDGLMLPVGVDALRNTYRETRQ